MSICVCWLPTIWQSANNLSLRRFETEQNISDFGSQKAVLKVYIEHTESSPEEARKDPNLIKRPIHVHLSWDEGEESDRKEHSAEFNLNYLNHSPDGMVVYKYDKPQNFPTDFDKFLEGICYHHIKSLFHNHEVHSDRDYGLKAYIPNSKQKFDVNCINMNDNEVLLFFIKQYEDTFSSYAEISSRQLRKYDGIDAKFKGQISQQDKNGGVPGYKNLVAYGLSDFRQWYNDPNHIKEVKQLKKDVLKWSLRTDPLKKGISHYLYTYCDRINKITTKYEEIKRKFSDTNTPPPTNQELKDFLDLGNKIKGVNYSLNKKILLVPHNYYRHELEAINKILSEIEIDLGIYKPNTLQYYITPLFFFYRRLKKHYHNIFLITKETRMAIAKTCEAASTEYVYCKTLLESPYNWAFKPDNFSEHAVEGRRTALNIRNSIRYIETVKYRFANAQTGSTHSILYKADWISKIAIGIAVISMIVSIISLLLK